MRQGLATACLPVLGNNATIRAQHGGPSSASKPSARRHLSGRERPATRHSGRALQPHARTSPGRSLPGLRPARRRLHRRSTDATELPLMIAQATPSECLSISVCPYGAPPGGQRVWEAAAACSAATLVVAVTCRSRPALCQAHGSGCGWQAVGGGCMMHALAQVFLLIAVHKNDTAAGRC